MNVDRIHEKSQETVDSSLDIFSPPSTKTSVLKGSTIEVDPVSGVDGTVIDFHVKTNGSEYIDLRNTLLHVQCKVITSGNDVIAAGNDLKIMPINNFMHSIFASCEFGLNNHTMKSDTNYPYTSYMSHLISDGSSRKSTISAVEGSIWDESGPLDKADMTNPESADVTNRKKLIAGSKVVDMVGPLDIDFFRQDKYLIPNVDLKIRLTKSDARFCLVKPANDDTNYKIKITKCVLLLRQVTIHPSIVSTQNALLMAGNPVLYPMERTELQTFTISGGNISERINIRNNQQQPKRILVAFVSHDAKNGNYDTDPLKFHHFKCTSISLDVDGYPIPSKPIEMDFDNDKYSRAYFNLASVAGVAFGDDDHGITLKGYAKGRSVFGFDLTPDLCHGQGSHLISNSTIILDVKFKEALANTISVIVFSELDDLIEIDHERVIRRLSNL